MQIMVNATRENLLFMAMVAEEAERYDDMIHYLKELAQLNIELTVGEGNILTSGYKNAISKKRAAWKMLCYQQMKEEKSNNTTKVHTIVTYKKVIEPEIIKLSNDVSMLIDSFLLPSSAAEESKVYCYKLKGDFLRCVAEIQPYEERLKTGVVALAAYSEAKRIADASMSATNLVKLGLIVNFSVFYFEITQQPEKALELAKKCYDDAIQGLDSMPEHDYNNDTSVT